MSDDQTTAYVLATQTYFEDLKQVAAQLAGLLVLEASGAAPGLHSDQSAMLISARAAYQNAVDGLNSVRVPLRAGEHHRHLLSAAEKLGEALQTKRDPLIPLEGAYADLRAASRTLPGFPMISFDHGCCAHAGRPAA